MHFDLFSLILVYIFSLSFFHFLSIPFDLGNVTLGNSEIFYYLNIYIHVARKNHDKQQNIYILDNLAVLQNCMLGWYD